MRNAIFRSDTAVVERRHDDPAEGDTGRIGNGHRCRCDRVQCDLGAVRKRTVHACERLLGITMDPGDRGAREDVVELLGQHVGPELSNGWNLD